MTKDDDDVCIMMLVTMITSRQYNCGQSEGTGTKEALAARNSSSNIPSSNSNGGQIVVRAKAQAPRRY